MVEFRYISDYILYLIIKILFFSSYSFFIPILLLIFLLAFSKYIYIYNKLIFKEVYLISFFFIFFFYVSLLFIYSSLVTPLFFSDIIIINNFNINLTLGIDNISLLFAVFIAFIFFLCIIINWNYNNINFYIFVVTSCIMYILLLLAFMTYNILYFFIFFEATLIPMFIIINKWGSRQRKIHANYYFFLYTIFGSILLFIGIIMLLFTCGTTNINLISEMHISCDRQIIIWFLLFSGFIIKIPLPPFHAWLPEAHVEAPAFGSVILAAILLKLGSYGIFRFLLPIFDFANLYFTNYVLTLCAIALIYTSFITIRQVDLKKIIAYSSVSHMSIITIGLFLYSEEALSGSMFFMFSHGFVSAGLFIIIGILYNRMHTRSLFYFNNIASKMPMLGVFLFIFILANMGFPLTSGFIGEFIIFIYTSNANAYISILCVLSTISTSIYSIWLYSRVSFSNNKNFIYFNNHIYRDLNMYEFFVCFFVVMPIIILGLFPNFILNNIIISLINY